MVFITHLLLSIPLVGAYAILALGISVIYRASRVLNLAHGAMAMAAAYVADSLALAGLPIGVALAVAVAFGAALGVAVEAVFVRRLRPQGPTAQTVGTVAVTGLLISLAAKVWGTTPRIGAGVFPEGVVRVGDSGIRYGAIGLFLTGLAVSAALVWFFRRTEVGLAMRGAAQNRRAASLMGIDPDRAASAAWALGGGLAALAGVMLAAVTTLDPYVLSLQALPAFVAALVGGLESLPGALGGSVIAGLAFGLVPFFDEAPLVGRLARYNGSPQLALTVLTLVVLMLRGRRLAGAEAREVGLVAAGRRSSRRAAPGGRGLTVGLALLALWPWVVPFSVLQNSLLTLQLAVVAISIVVLTGWVGQISLAQASFVGIAALTMGLVVRGTGLGFPVSMLVGAGAAGLAAVLLGVVALRVRGLYLAVATLVFAWMCDAFLFKAPFMGAGTGSSVIPPQRFGERGGWPFLDLASERTIYYVFLAIAAIVVAGLANLRDTKTGRALFAVRGSEVAAASLGIDVVRTKLAAFALAGVLAGVSGSMLMLAQRAVVPDQFLFTVSLQYLAIAVVGGLASLGGAVAAGGLFAALNELFLRVAALSGWLEVVSAGLLAVVLLAYPAGLVGVLDGARRRAEALAAGLRGVAARVRAVRRRLRAARREEAPAAPASERREAPPAPAERQEALPAPASDGGVRRAAGWLARPLGRVAAASARLGRRLGRALPLPVAPRIEAEDWFRRVFAAAPSSDGSSGGAPGGEPRPDGGGPAAPTEAAAPREAGLAELAARVAAPLVPDRSARRPVLEARGVTVRFGGLTAVSDASLEVREGEIVGLIGPNGAGKTTLFNAILGLNDPVAGEIRLHGRDATALPPHLRARLGVARTFQVLQLFSELTVFDNLLTATHMHNDSGMFANLAATPRTIAAERAARLRVRQVLRLLGLEDVADREARGLPFGVLRLVELGRALVTGATLVMLDEPASGLNDRETDRLMEVIRGIRALGVAVLLIEHDVRMVTGTSDYVYVLDQGRVISEGPPAAVQRDPRVIHAYLGAVEEEEARAEVSV
jgi:ABC-type branched-subunit amino acid transport system ATPase component/branched-subunit amino acid ABC-type transport system permease component